MAEKKSRPIIRRYRSLSWFEPRPGLYVRKQSVEVVDETVPGSIRLVTNSGFEIRLSTKEAKEALSQLNFNER